LEQNLRFLSHFGGRQGFRHSDRQGQIAFLFINLQLDFFN
jgi:hypothetical protein